MEKINCKLCGNKEYKLLFYAKDRFDPNISQFCVVRCVACGLKYLNPRPTRDEIHHFYPREYWSNRDVYDNEKQRLIGNDIQEGNILDIGCATGSFLQAMKQRGFNVYGVELSEEAVLLGRQLGTPIYQGDLLDVSFEKSFFDLVTIWSSLEHFHDPINTLKKVYQIMKKDASLIITVPNASSYQALLFRSYFAHVDAPRHLFHFTPYTLINCLKISKLTVKRLEFTTSFYHPTSVFKDSIINTIGENSQRIFQNKFIESFLKIFYHFESLSRRGPNILLYAKK